MTSLNSKHDLSVTTCPVMLSAGGGFRISSFFVAINRKHLELGFLEEFFFSKERTLGNIIWSKHLCCLKNFHTVLRSSPQASYHHSLLDIVQWTLELIADS